MLKLSLRAYAQNVGQLLSPTFLYFDLYMNTAYTSHYVYWTLHYYSILLTDGTLE